MIYEKDLRDAIAECQGKRNPDANTCIKMAAYFTLLQNLYPEEKPAPEYFQMASGDNSDPVIDYDSDTEFSNLIRGRSAAEIMPVMDDLMNTLQVLNPRLYDAVLQKLK